MEERKIEWFTTPLCGNLVALQITEQSHRQEQFTPTGMKFTALNGQRIISESSPERNTRSVVFVRGRVTDRDMQPAILCRDELLAVEQALSEYNFVHSPYAATYEITRYDTPMQDEPYYWRNSFTNVGHHEAAKVLVLVKKQIQPTGEQCVGRICRIWDNSKDDAHIGLVTKLSEVGFFTDDKGDPWYNAIPVTPEELRDYLVKATEVYNVK